MILSTDAGATAITANAPAPPIEPVVAAGRGLVKSFDHGRVPVLRGADLAISRGERVALIGANGAGKSTLLRCLLRLTSLDAGQVELFGTDATSLGPRQLRPLRQRIGMVFQRHNLVERLSVLTNVLHGAHVRTASPRIWRQCFAPAVERTFAMHCLEQVGLADLAMRPAGRLSGGQSQRVAVARALMQRPEMLFADEPAASLDPQSGAEVMGTFDRLVEEQRMTLVFVSHNLHHALQYGRRVVGLQAGRVTLDAPASSLSAHDLLPLYD